MKQCQNLKSKDKAIAVEGVKELVGKQWSDTKGWQDLKMEAVTHMTRSTLQHKMQSRQFHTIDNIFS